MEHAFLGGTGIEVSRVCFGAMMLGRFGNRDADECDAMVRTALDAGINFIDTADGYGFGESEEIVGRALRGRRDDVVVATKFRTPMRNAAGEERNRRGASRRWIVQALEESLRRLGTDHVDLYQLHRPDPATDPEETLGALSDLVRQGKVRAIGASATDAERIVEWQWLAERRHLERMRCEQAPYNLFRRRIERNVLPTCRRYGVGVITYGPLDGSWLTGRYRSAADVPLTARLAAETDRRHGGWDPESEANRRKGELLAPLLDLAEGAGLPLTHLATAFTLAHPDVTSVIIGPRTPEQLQDSLAAADLRLDDDVLDRIDQIVTPGTDVIANHAQTAPPEMAVAYRRGRRAT